MLYFSLVCIGISSVFGMEDPRNNDSYSSSTFTSKSMAGEMYGTEINNQEIEDRIQRELQCYSSTQFQDPILLLEYNHNNNIIGVVHDIQEQKTYISYVETNNVTDTKLYIDTGNTGNLDQIGELAADDYMPNKFRSRTVIFKDSQISSAPEQSTNTTSNSSSHQSPQPPPLTPEQPPLNKSTWYNPFTWGKSTSSEEPNQKIRRFQENSKSKFEQQKLQNKHTGERIDYKFASKRDQEIFEGTVQSIMQYYHDPEIQQSIKKYCNQCNPNTYRLARQEAENRLSNQNQFSGSFTVQAPKKEELQQTPIVPLYNKNGEMIDSMPADQVKFILADLPELDLCNAQENKTPQMPSFSQQLSDTISNSNSVRNNDNANQSSLSISIKKIIQEV